MIESGKWKGKKISTLSSVRGNAHFTPSLLKKSLFSILDAEVLSGKWTKEKAVFIDGFAGSGQIAVEALSRGFSRVILFELDKNRFRDLQKNISSFSGEFSLFHKDAFRFLPRIELAESETPVFFLDPPYTFWENSEKIYELCKEIIERFSICTIIVQSPANPNWENWNIRNQGNHFLLSKLS